MSEKELIEKIEQLEKRVAELEKNVSYIQEDIYEFVEDDVEWEAVAKLFDQMLEDVDLQA